MAKKILMMVAILLGLSGCSTVPTEHGVDTLSQESPMISESLFASDQAILSDDAVLKALEGVIRMPVNARVALLDLSPDRQSVRYYGWSYWRSEQYMNQQRRYFDALSVPLSALEKVKEVVPVPSFTVHKKMTLSQIREAAVRMQIDSLAIYSLRSDIFQRYRFFSNPEIKAYATCEVALFDTRTGLMPFTDVLTVKVLVKNTPSQENMEETRMRAEIEASESCLGEIGGRLSGYYDSH